jgi:hypothetical protein
VRALGRVRWMTPGRKQRLWQSSGRLEAALQQRRRQQAAAEHCAVWAGRRSLKTWVGMQTGPRVVGRWHTRARCGAAARISAVGCPGCRGVIAGPAKGSGRLYTLHGYLTCYRRRAGACLASGGPHKIKRRSSVRGGLDERVWAGVCCRARRHCTCGRRLLAYRAATVTSA